MFDVGHPKSFGQFLSFNQNTDRNPRYFEFCSGSLNGFAEGGEFCGDRVHLLVVHLWLLNELLSRQLLPSGNEMKPCEVLCNYTWKYAPTGMSFTYNISTFIAIESAACKSAIQCSAS